MTINDIKHFTRLRGYTAEDLIDYHTSACGEYAVDIKFGRADSRTKPPYVPKYSSRAQIMAGKSSNLSQSFGVPSYQGAAELRRECEKRKEIVLPMDMDSVKLENGMMACIVKPSDEGTFVKKAVMVMPQGIDCLEIKGDYTVVPSLLDTNR